MSETPITCWLIERGQAVGHEPTLWWGKYPDTEMERWTRAASDAMRFPTMEAAQRYANLYSGPHCTVTEHVFLDREVAPVDVIGLVVDEFLRWPLPASVCSDPCACTPGYPNRSGTNLLTAQEARQMFEFLIGKLPRAGSRIERAATESCCRRAEALERELAALREEAALWKEGEAVMTRNAWAWKDRAEQAEAQLAERDAEIAALKGRLHEIAEEWAGAECGEPVTAQEGYAIGLCKRMYRLATYPKE